MYIVQARHETFWETKMSRLTHDHAVKFQKYGVPSEYINTFTRIFNAMQNTF